MEQNGPAEENEEQLEEPNTLLEAKLRIESGLPSQTSFPSPTTVIRSQIESLRHQRRLATSTDILNYWETRKDDALYDIAKVVLGVPATQVSVERAFSALALVLTSRRTRLNDDTLNDILICKCNHDLKL